MEYVQRQPLPVVPLPQLPLQSQRQLDEQPHKFLLHLVSIVSLPDMAGQRKAFTSSSKSHTSFTLGRTGKPRCSAVFPGVTPPTIFVPHAIDSFAFAVASHNECLVLIRGKHTYLSSCKTLEYHSSMLTNPQVLDRTLIPSTR